MPISTAPYKRSYLHTKARGRETPIYCGICGRLVPRYKTFPMKRGFILNDPVIFQNVDKKYIHVLPKRKIRLCPSCARFHGVVQPGKSVRKKHLEM